MRIAALSRRTMEHAATGPPATLSLHEEGDSLALEGALETSTLAEFTRSLAQWLKERGADRHVRALDLKGLSGLDTPGALFLRELREKGVELTGASAEHKALLEFIDGLELEPLPQVPATPRWRKLLIDIGRGADEAARDSYAIVAFLGRSASEIARVFAHPSHLRLPSISRHIAETGISALPIVGLMAVMISIVIAYQGVVQ